MNCLTYKSDIATMTKIIMLFFIMLLCGCTQGPDQPTTQKPAAPVFVKKLEINSEGIDFIKFGTSFEEVKKLLVENKLQTDQVVSDGESLLFVNAPFKINEVPFSRLTLRFNSKKELGSIEFTTNMDSWKATETYALKLGDKITELFGKPIKSNKITEELFGHTTKTKEYMSWKNKDVLTTSNVTLHSENSSTTLGFDATLQMQHTKYASKSSTVSNGTSSAKNTLTKAGKRIKAKYPTWDDETCNVVGSGQISIGMTKEQVRAAWGRPYKVNKTTNAYGTSEQWVMNEFGGSYVYFEGDTCTTIQN